MDGTLEPFWTGMAYGHQDTMWQSRGLWWWPVKLESAHFVMRKLYKRWFDTMRGSLWLNWPQSFNKHVIHLTSPALFAEVFPNSCKTVPLSPSFSSFWFKVWGGEFECLGWGLRYSLWGTACQRRHYFIYSIRLQALVNAKFCSNRVLFITSQYFRGVCDQVECF